MGVLLILVCLVALLAALGWPRVHPVRRTSLEGIEDPQAAAAYDRISRWPQFRLLRRMTVRRLSQYRPTGVLVDLGCGPGRLTTLIAQAFPGLQVVGVDTAREMILAASSNAVSLALSERVQFREGDVVSLPFSECGVDFVLSSLSLHHWSDPDRGLAEIARVLRPGGQVLLYDLRRDPRRFFYLLIMFAQSVVVPSPLRRINEPLGSVLSSYTPAELTRLFRRSPFREWTLDTSAGWMFAWGRKGA